MKNILLILFFLPLIGIGQCINGDCENGCNAIKEYTTQDGGTARYEGCFKNAEFNGQGKYFQNKELMYDGVFLNGEWEREGKLYQDENLIYDGYFKDGKKHGFGIYYFDDGTEWSGEWVQNDKGVGHYNHENYYNPKDIIGLRRL